MGDPIEPKKKKHVPKKIPDISKNRQELIAFAESLGVNPFEILLRFAAGDWKGLGYDSATVLKYTSTGKPYEEDRITPDNRINSSGIIVRHILPSLKAVDISTTDPNKSFTVTMNLTEPNAGNQPEPSGDDPTPKPTS